MSNIDERGRFARRRGARFVEYLRREIPELVEEDWLPSLEHDVERLPVAGSEALEMGSPDASETLLRDSAGKPGTLDAALVTLARQLERLELLLRVTEDLVAALQRVTVAGNPRRRPSSPIAPEGGVGSCVPMAKTGWPLIPS